MAAAGCDRRCLMAGEYTGVGLGTHVPDILPKLSQLLTIQHQQTQLASEQQSQRQRAAMAKYDWGKHIGEDGTVDLNTLNDPELMEAAGDQYQEVLGRAIQAKTAQLESKRTLTALRGDQREAFAEIMGALRSDKDVAEDNEKGRQKVTQELIRFGEIYGEDVLPVLQAYAAPLQKAPKGRMSDAIRAIQLQANTAGEQLERQKPQYASTGGELTNINPLAAPGAAPGTIPLTLPPGVEILTDQKGAQFAFDRQKNTVTPVGEGRAPAGPNAAPGQPTFTQPSYVGQADDIRSQQAEVANVRTAADAAPMNRNIFQHVLKLADETSTGPLVSYLQNTKIGGQIFGDNYQELGKYLEKNAISNMQAMGGPPSDARLSAAVAANGSTSFNPKALKAVTQFNYATNTGLEKYRQGVDKAVGTRNPDYGQLPEFKANWARNFDIRAFELENAISDGDTVAQKAILDSMNKPQRAALAQKMENLDSLAATGKLP
jgi:hypothetical protein